jgi:hypothetical protein
VVAMKKVVLEPGDSIAIVEKALWSKLEEYMATGEGECDEPEVRGFLMADLIDKRRSMFGAMDKSFATPHRCGFSSEMPLLDKWRRLKFAALG